jgi:hypothetical protein
MHISDHKIRMRIAASSLASGIVTTGTFVYEMNFTTVPFFYKPSLALAYTVAAGYSYVHFRNPEGVEAGKAALEAFKAKRQAAKAARRDMRHGVIYPLLRDREPIEPSNHFTIVRGGKEASNIVPLAPTNRTETRRILKGRV